MAEAGDDEPIAFADAEALQAWLEREHGSANDLWILLAKVGSGIPSVTQPEALDLMLRYGWIDAVRRSFDERRYLQRYTPRRARSRWSQINRKRAEELLELGLMAPAGVAEVERARADGRWEAAYAPQRTAEVPADLVAALAAAPAAAELFARLASRNRYAILHRVAEAKRVETRARRIAMFVAMLAEGRTIH